MIEEYPPLLPLDEGALHCAHLYGEAYWACMFPERPPNGNAAYDWRCRSCVRAAEADMEILGDKSLSWWPQAYQDKGPPTTVNLSWLIARSKYHLDMP